MSRFLNAADWTFPVPIRYGPGRLSELGTACHELGIKNGLIVTDRGSRDLPFIELAQQSCAAESIGVGLFSEVSPNPTDEDIALGKETLLKGNYDGVIAIGGGSGMDAGKAISLIGGNDLDLWDFDYDKPDSPGLEADQFPPLICIPTTAGTGAETESTAMVTDIAQGIKRCIWHSEQKPRLAILDPELTIGLPPDLTAWTGCDALVHAIEAFSVPDWHPLCDGLALEAIRLISSSLPTAVDQGDNLEARGAMLVGSCLAGVSFLKGLGLVHAMSHMVGAVCDTHHGLTNAVLLPPVLAYNRKELGEKIPLMSEAMGLPSKDYDSFFSAILDLLDALAIPRGLEAIGVPQQMLDPIAQKAYSDAARFTNPTPSTVPQIRKMLGESFRNAR
jgi:alcohol dehydrogenase class IV